MNDKPESVNNPLVSIIVPVYNVALYIEDCLKTILEQTYGNLEIILVEDCSTDNSLSICKKYADLDKRIKLLSNEQNSGVSFSRNRALDCATGYYVAMIDSDDWIATDYIERMVKAMEQTDADTCACGYVKWFEDNRASEAFQITDEQRVETNTKILDYAMRKKAPFVGYTLGKMYKKNLLDTFQVRFDTTISLCEDSLFNYSYLDCVSNCVLLKECLYFYRIRQQSATRSATPEKIKTKLYAFQKSLEIAQKYANSVFFYRMNAVIMISALQYVYASILQGVELPKDEYKQMLHIARESLRRTKIKYADKKQIILYYALRAFPKLTKRILRMKSGKNK